MISILLLATLGQVGDIGSVRQGKGLFDGGAWNVNVLSMPASGSATAQGASRDGGYDWGVNVDNKAVGEAMAVRCVNTAGNAFEACGGAGASGLTDAELRATPVPMSLTSTTLTGTSAVSLATLPALTAGTANIGDVDVLTLPSVTIGTFPDNEPFNVAQWNGVTALAGNGVSGTGSPRVTIASDNTAFSVNAIQSGSWSLAANQSTNIAQMNGVAVAMGNGISGTGVQRVTLASDGTGVVGLSTGANVIGALTANQSVNQTQVNGVAVSVGNGIAGTGVQRVTIASDNTAFPVTLTSTTITGTVAATQSGTWTVQPGNTANTTPWLTTDTPRTVASANNTGTCVSVTASTTVLASNASRRAYYFKASSSNTDKVHCKLGATATTSNVIYGAGDAFGQDTGAVYTGVIDCIAASGTQSVCPYEMN